MDNVITLATDLINIKSVSQQNNVAISDYIECLLIAAAWQVERTSYRDENGEEKVNLVAKLGDGTGGLAFCSHSDTVPGQEDDWAAFDAQVKDGKLYGRGSCDMKGPLAATLVAALAVDPASLKKPLYIIVTSDEELGLLGAKFIAQQSVLLRESRPTYGIIAEPTNMLPVYSHKGFGRIFASACGKSAHSSTGFGESALLKCAPFLNDLKAIADLLESDETFHNADYTPPTQTLNAMIETEPTAINVTAERAVVRVSFRPMPDSRSEEVHQWIIDSAEAHGLDVVESYIDPLFLPPTAELVTTVVEITGRDPVTASFGTDGNYLRQWIDQLIVLGAGDIAQAHTVGEYVSLAQLQESVEVYSQLITRFCQ